MQGLKARKSMSTKSNEVAYWKGDIVILLNIVSEIEDDPYVILMYIVNSQSRKNC